MKNQNKNSFSITSALQGDIYPTSNLLIFYNSGDLLDFLDSRLLYFEDDVNYGFGRLFFGLCLNVAAIKAFLSMLALELNLIGLMKHGYWLNILAFTSSYKIIPYLS